jgi:hypothetical protein
MAMMGKILIAFTLVLGACDNSASLGKAILDFSEPSEWVVVRGYIGDIKIQKGSAKFLTGNRLEVRWEASSNGETFVCVDSRVYTLDADSGLPKFPAPSNVEDIYGVSQWSVKMNGQLLELVIDRVDGGLRSPSGRLLLILKPAH